MFFLRQSTAAIVPVGQFVDKTDGVTPESGLAGTMVIYLHKAGGDPAARNSATAITYPANAGGHYSIPLDTTDTNTLGTLRLHVTGAANHLGVWEDYMVMPANAWDSLFGSDKLQVDTVEWLGTALATPDTAGYPKTTIKDGTGTGEIDTSGGAVPVYDLSTAALNDIWTTVIAEAYAADGAAATPAQLLYMLLSAVAEFSIAGTTITCKKLDGATTAMTFTISDAANPTSRTRAT